MKKGLIALFIIALLFMLLALALWTSHDGFAQIGAVYLFEMAIFSIIVILIASGLQYKLLNRLAITTFIILALLYYFFIYKKNRKYTFVLPHNYRGYVILVYGIKDKPSLPYPLFSNEIKLNVPPSGIIVTKSIRDCNCKKIPAFFVDSILGDIHELSSPSQRHDWPYPTTSLPCFGKDYVVDICY